MKGRCREGSAAHGGRAKKSSREEPGGVGRTGKPISTEDKGKLSEGQCCDNTQWTDCLGRQGLRRQHRDCLPRNQDLSPHESPRLTPRGSGSKPVAGGRMLGTDGVEHAG